MPLLPNSDEPTWVRIADPTASEITLTRHSKESLAWLLSCVQSTHAKPLSDPHLLHCVSAADAMAEGHCRDRGLAVHQGRTALVLRDLVHVQGAGSDGPKDAQDGTQPFGTQVPVLRHACRFRQHSHRGRSEQALLYSLAS